MRLVVQGALANANIQHGDKVFAEFLKDNFEDVYIIQDVSPGIKNALDWKIVIDTLSAASSVATLADLLWKAYEKFIVPLKKEHAFIFVSLENDKRKNVQFSIGQEYKDKKIFIETFEKEVESLNNDTNITTITREQTTKIEIK